MEEGNLLLLPHGDAHIVRSLRRTGGLNAPTRVEYRNAIRRKSNTNDETDTELICGSLQFEAVPDSFVIAALPSAIVLTLGSEKLAGRTRMLMEAIDEELEVPRPGAMAVATDLASALFVMMLRAHFEQTASSSDLIRLLASPPLARAVTAMLEKPSDDWTLDQLAAEAHVSRATLVRLFRKTIGNSPLAFLADLRLGIARQRLVSTSASLGQVAADVGYESESAFTRAFQRRFGTSPGKVRNTRQKSTV